MTMPPPLRKLLLTVHVTSSVGWLGALTAYLALNAVALEGATEQAMRAAYLMMEPVAYYALVPLAASTLATGVLQALGTPWGLFRHYWVVISLVVTAFAFMILIQHLPAIKQLATLAANPNTDVASLGGDLVHSVGGFLVLLVPLVLNIYKPRGLTRYGWRKGQQRRATTVLAD